jgi:hypothetical protein
LPISLRPEGAPVEAVVTQVVPEDAPAKLEAAATTGQLRAPESSPYAGTSLDWQASVERYLAKKKRA